MSTDASRPSMGYTGIRRVDLPIVNFSWTAGLRSTTAQQIPPGASIIRVIVPTFSAPMMITVVESSTQSGAFLPLRPSSQSTGAVRTFAPLGGSTSAGGVVMAPDMACCGFIKFISSKVQGLSGKNIQVLPYG